MIKIKILEMDLVFYCPILEEQISDSYCYEINAVAFGLCKPSLIDNITDRQTAESVCENCKNRQM
jgi:hypothetical protein